MPSNMNPRPLRVMARTLDAYVRDAGHDPLAERAALALAPRMCATLRDHGLTLEDLGRLAPVALRGSTWWILCDAWDASAPVTAQA